MVATSHSARFLAVKVLQDVLLHQRSLTDSLLQRRPSVKPQESGLLQELCFGVLRHHFSLSDILAKRLQKPLRSKDSDIHTLLLIGLYQIRCMHIQPHAAVNETVAITKKIKKSWASSLVNAILRGYLRAPDAAGDAHLEHPQWLIECIKTDWPDDWQAILQANNQRPPMTLRVNRRLTTRAAYQQALAAQSLESIAVPGHPDGLFLVSPVGVNQLPSFVEGHVSVQDSSAQWVARLLQLEPGATVLDACAAPGGKTAHLVEVQPQLKKVVAIEVDEQRALKIGKTARRLRHPQIEVITGDATRPDQWWNGQLFDRILLDAPCSGSGVIRRHPDIKFLRRPTDIDKAATIQKKLLCTLWPLLKPGGILLYSTCSIMQQENSAVITAFMREMPCKEINIDVPDGRKQSAGTQILPGGEKMNGDGFYLACLAKQ